MKRLLTAACVTAFATPAFAHLPPGEYGSFTAGFSHPLFGLDHILTMVAVGLWAGVLGGRALWIVPSAFVSIMLVGFALALMHVPLPHVEAMILASTIVLGLAVAIAARLDVRLCSTLVGTFALFHGHAHGGELGQAGALQFGLGFALATALLHGAGVGIGVFAGLSHQRSAVISRGLGALIALAGMALAIA